MTPSYFLYFSIEIRFGYDMTHFMTDGPQNHTEQTRSHEPRQFRRYQRYKERRAKAAQAENSFMTAVFSLAGIAGAFAIGLGVWTMNAITMEPSGSGEVEPGIATPWLGPFSKIEVGGFVLIGILAIVYLYRTRRR